MLVNIVLPLLLLKQLYNETKNKDLAFNTYYRSKIFNYIKTVKVQPFLTVPSCTNYTGNLINIQIKFILWVGI